MTSEAMRDGNKQHFENLLFSKKGTPSKGQVSGHPGHPPRSAPDIYLIRKGKMFVKYEAKVE